MRPLGMVLRSLVGGRHRFISRERWSLAMQSGPGRPYWESLGEVVVVAAVVMVGGRASPGPAIIMVDGRVKDDKPP